MKKSVKALVCLSASLMMSVSALAAKVELYSLDGRSLHVEEDQVSVYTAEGMGWFKEKPVTMYAEDGRTLVVPADRVAAHKEVGWFLKEDLESGDNKAPAQKEEEPAKDNGVSDKVSVKYTDGTVVKVPSYHVEMYKALGWIVSGNDTNNNTATEKKTVVMYDSNGNAKEVDADDVGRYELEGWSTVKPSVNLVTVYSYDGSQKKVDEANLESEKANGWYPAYDEAVYSYAAFGNGADAEGATKLLENKKYEAAFLMVEDALKKLENTDSEYISLLYYLRTSITDTWREAANSPLGFVNYWFSEKNGKKLVVFEYRNVSNSRIQSFRINFDVCNAAGEVIETNSGSYYVENLQMAPCEKKRVAWAIESKDAASVKNVKVKEAVFSDGTKWTAAN